MADTTSSSSSAPGDDGEHQQTLHELDKMTFLAIDNSEACHTKVLADAKRLHDAVRERALHVLRTERDEAEAKRLREQANTMEKQVAAAEKKAREQMRIREAENRAKRIPQPPPKLPTPPPQTPTPPIQQPQVQQPAPVNRPPPPVARPSPQASQNAGTPAGTSSPVPPQPLFRQPQVAPVQQPPVQQRDVQQSPVQQAAPAEIQPAPQQPTQASTPQAQSAALAPDVSKIMANGPRYVEIHKKLKELRKYIDTQTVKAFNVTEKVKVIREKVTTYKEVTTYHSVKTYAGHLRRSLRKTLGQMSLKPGANAEQTATVRAALKGALEHPSPPCNPMEFLVASPTPVEGAELNGDTLPTLFIFVMNTLAKVIVAQLSSEAATTPEVADHIGVLIHNIISHPQFMWRGVSFMDIIMAKFRVTLPVVFGARGSERTEEGRARLGWRRAGKGWMNDQDHTDRMRGLGAGYAALCLRNYSKSARTNPWPAYHYWIAMSLIITTPEAEKSATQLTVLTSLINGNEKKFLEFYGDMAIAALRAAVVEVPDRSLDQNSAAVNTLRVLGDRLRKDLGLALRV